MGSVTFGIPEELALGLRDGLGLRAFIETGTFRGGTAGWAAEHFERAVTIEAYQPYFERAAAARGDRPNLRFVFGDSRIELGRILAGEPEPALIWLDAHWCGNREMSAGTPGECPLREELEAIRAYGVKHVILIDDARLFVEGPPPPHDPAQWPTFEEIRSLLPPGYTALLYQDVIVAVPQRAAALARRLTGQAAVHVAVLTSNAYLGCIPAFGYLFNQFWGDDQPVTIVRYEEKPAKPGANFSNFAVGRQADYTWSGGLLRYLKFAPEMLVLLLEDYFLDRPVDRLAVLRLWEFMEAHPEVVKIDLSGDRLKFEHEDFNDDLVRAGDKSLFQTSLQAAIWRRDFLERFLDARESPWEFERKGTRRVVGARGRGEFDGLILGARRPPLSYVNAVGGEGRRPGEWDLKKFPEWMLAELAERGLFRTK